MGDREDTKETLPSKAKVPKGSGLIAIFQDGPWDRGPRYLYRTHFLEGLAGRERHETAGGKPRKTCLQARGGSRDCNWPDYGDRLASLSDGDLFALLDS